MVTTAQIIQPNMECFYQIYLKCVVYDNVCDLRIQEVQAIYYNQI